MSVAGWCHDKSTGQEDGDFPSQAYLSLNFGLLGESWHLSSLVFLSAQCRAGLDYLEGSPPLLGAVFL